MKISDELKRRIQMLEQEQQQQSDDLGSLEQLRDLASIEELEQELSSIDQDMPVPDKARNVKDDINLSEDVLSDEELDEIDEPVNSDHDMHDIDLTLEGLGANKTKAQHGYVVCLMFNPNAPTEWSEESGGGWRGKGSGTSYPTRAKADKMLQELKQKWPDYPIKLHQVK